MTRYSSRYQEALGEMEGLTVADVGAGACSELHSILEPGHQDRLHALTGTGLFLPLLSRAVGDDGRVYAIEISPGFLKLLTGIVEKEGLSNAELVQGDERSPNLPEGAAVDLVFICDVYHHFERPVTYLKALRASMKPGARLILIDFHRVRSFWRVCCLLYTGLLMWPCISHLLRPQDPDRMWSKPGQWVLDHVRAGREVFEAEVLSAGFVLEREVQIETLRENYFLIFRRP
jgi:SAM-dependent methyltransferase